MDEFYVHENWTIDKAIVHRGDCSFCKRGQGIHANAGGRNSKWHGSFDGADLALTAARAMKRTRTEGCRVCQPARQGR